MNRNHEIVDTRGRNVTDKYFVLYGYIRLTLRNTCTHTENMVRVPLSEYVAGQYKTYFINTSQSNKI